MTGMDQSKMLVQSKVDGSDCLGGGKKEVGGKEAGAVDSWGFFCLKARLGRVQTFKFLKVSDAKRVLTRASYLHNLVIARVGTCVPVVCRASEWEQCSTYL